MKGIISICVAVITSFTLMTSPAMAEVYPNERPLNDPMINALIVDAHQYHNQRTAGTHCSPENTIVTVADDLRVDGDVMRRAEAKATLVTKPQSSCKIIFNGLLLARHQTKMQSKSVKAWTTFNSTTNLPLPRWHAAVLCHVVYHEVGHNEGLEHTETGLMLPGNPELLGKCINWARKVVPRPQRK